MTLFRARHGLVVMLPGVCRLVAGTLGFFRPGFTLTCWFPLVTCFISNCYNGSQCLEAVGYTEAESATVDLWQVWFDGT